MDLKDQWGYKDPRNTPEYEELRHLCQRHLSRFVGRIGCRAARVPGTAAAQGATAPAARGIVAAAGGVNEEALVKLITDEVIRQMQA